MNSNDNPYQTPGVDLTHDPEFGEIDGSSAFAPRGRFTRLSFIAWSVTYTLLATLALGVVFGVLLAITGLQDGAADALSLVVSLPLSVLAIIFAIRRLHDINASGWWLLLYIVPVVNLVFYIVLLVKGGAPGPNDFGPPRPTTGAERVAGIVGIILLALLPLVLLAVAIPAYNAYLEQARLMQGG